MKLQSMLLPVLLVLALSGVSFALSCGDTITTSTTLTASDPVVNNICPGNGIIVGASGITLDCAGYNLSGDGIGDFQYGILLPSGITDVTVKNCNVTRFFLGIGLNSASGNTLASNNLYNNTYGGIYINSSSNNILADNNAYNNVWYGIELYSSSNNNTIIGNNAYNNVHHGILIASSSNNNLTGNNAYNNPEYGIYLLSSSNNTLTSNNAYSNSWSGVYSSSSNYNDFIGNSIHNNPNGIFLVGSLNNNLTDNNIYQNSYGIVLASSSYCTLTGNSANNNLYDGIRLRDSSMYNNLTGNTAYKCGTGIDLVGSSYNNLTGNTAYNNAEGILINGAVNNALIGNIAYNNSQTGIHLYYHANNNLLTGNNAYYNGQYGIRLDSLSGNNNLTANNLTNNTNGLYLSLGSDYILVYNNLIAYNTAKDLTNYGANNTGDFNSCGTVINWKDISALSGCFNTTVFCTDLDGDGYGIYPNNGTASACRFDGNDCNDNNAAIHPNAAEVCNGVDDNCNGQIDEGGVCPTITYYCDTDGDGFISATPTGTCNTFNCIPAGCSTSPGPDFCPTAVGPFSGCPSAIDAIVTGQTKQGQQPLANVNVLAYNKAGCAKDFIPDSVKLFNSACKSDSSCTTNSAGLCQLPVAPGDYFVMVQVLDNSGKYPSHTVAQVTAGEPKEARLAFNPDSSWVWVVAVILIIGSALFVYNRKK